MGVLDLRYLKEQWLAIDRTDPLEGMQSEQMHEVGNLPISTKTTAMRVGSAPDRPELIFLGEVEIFVSPSRREVELSDGSFVRWYRLEIQANKRGRENSGSLAAQPGEWIVVAEHPWSNEWRHEAELKLSNKKGPQDPGRADPSSWPASSAEDAIRRLESLRCDPFEKGSLLTAAISEPDIALAWESSRNLHDGHLVFGLSRDPKADTETIFSSDVIRDMIVQTEENRIQFWFQASGDVPHVELHDETIGQCQSIMGVSILQALAGPFAKDGDGARWIERPVSDLVREIYLTHLNNYNRRIDRRNKIERPLSEWLVENDSPREAS